MLTYVYCSPISVGPLILMYGYELFREYKKDRENWRKKNKYFSAQMVKHKLVKEMSQHKSLRTKINCGLIPNFIIFAAWNGGFMYLFCAKLDQQLTLSIFVILIPFWILLLFLYAYLVLVGLASKNSRVNTCERVFLSLLVPIGFTTTIVLALCRLENYFQLPIYIIAIPEGCSMLFLYLYIRCLVKPSKGYFNRVDNLDERE